MLWLLVLAAAATAPAVAVGLWTTGAVTPVMAVHGALMLTAWGVLMPAGGVVARYFKVMPGQDFPRVYDNLAWWHWHRRLQYGGLFLSMIALALILSETGGRIDTLHGRCGVAVMCLGVLQAVSAWLRGTRGGPTDDGADPADPSTWRGDHFDMTPRRLAFEGWHKPMGWASLALAAVTALLGADLVGAPGWLLAFAGALQGALAIALLDGALRGRWVDTYAALWGLDPRLPGHRSPRRGPVDVAATSPSCASRVSRPSSRARG